MKKFLLFASAVALLAGCSKELTEEVTPVQVTGKSTIYATYDGGADATRTHLVPYGDKYKIKWDAGDAVGVFNYDVKGDDANSFFAYTKGDDKVGEFRGDMTLLDAKAYVAYYPYYSEAVIAEDGNLKIYIPAKQNYRTVTDNPDGTFAANVAPAVAYGETVTENSLEVTFHPLATYVQIPIQGIGTINSLELTIGAGETLKPLAGAVTVNVADVVEGKINPVMDVNGTTSIVLNCGKTGIVLSQEEPTYFWFVIPAGTDLYGQTMTLTINGDKGTLKRVFDYESSKPTPVNTPIELGQSVENDEAVPFEWIEDAEDKYVIKTEGEFVKYAYLASNPTPDSAENDEVASAMLRKDGTLKDAMIVNPLDFSQFTVSTNKDDYQGNAALFNAFEDEVYYSWYYQTNEMGISSIGGNKNYAIIGNGKLGVIQNLKVNGNGVFVATSGNKVKNITLKNVTVTTETAGRAYLVADNLWSFSNGVGENIKDIVLDGCTLKAEKAKSTALVNIMQSGWIEKFPIEYGEELPVTIKYVANELDVYTSEDVNVGERFFGETIKQGSTEVAPVLFGAVVPQDNGGNNGAILNVPSRANALGIIKAIKTDKTADNLNVEGTGWFSIMAADDNTSYYTGLTANKLKEDDYLTAEELVYHIKNGGNGVKMTHHIDLNYTSINSHGDYTWFKLDGQGKTITRAQVDASKGLFGPRGGAYETTLLVDIKNLNVTNSFYDITEGKEAFLLAKSGTATNVHASVSFRGTGAKDDLVAGLFYEANINDAVMTTNSSFTNGNTNYPLPEGAKLGAIYGKLDVCLGHTYKFMDTTFGKDAFAMLNCYMDAEEKHTSNTFIVFAGNEAPNAEEVVTWNTERGAIRMEHIVFFQNPQQAGSTASLSNKMYDGTVTTDASLAEALKEVQDDGTIIVGKGTYEFPSMENVTAKNVTIIAEGVTFTDASFGIQYIAGKNAIPDDLTIIGATFKATVANDDKVSSFAGELKNQTFKNCVFDYSIGSNFGLYSNGGTVTFDNCKFIGKDNGSALNIQPSFTTSDCKYVFDTCEFKGWVHNWGGCEKQLPNMTDDCQTSEFKNCTFTVGGWFSGSTSFDTCTFNFGKTTVDPDNHKSSSNVGIVLEPKVNSPKYTFTGCTNKGDTLEESIVKFNNPDVEIK